MSNPIRSWLVVALSYWLLRPANGAPITPPATALASSGMEPLLANIVPYETVTTLVLAAASSETASS